MSFSWNPYAVMDIVNRPDGTAFALCDSCGGDSERGPARVQLTVDSPLSAFRSWYDKHIWNSHRLSREDTKGWSTP